MRWTEIALSRAEQSADHGQSALERIAWPIPPGETASPVWTGHGFRLGGRILPVLPTIVSHSGWNQDLAALMATENSPDRPIGMASRRNAIRALRHHGGGAAGKVVLEIGCANGYMLEAMRSAFPEAVLVGCDYELPPLEALSASIPDVPLIQLDLSRPTLPDLFCDTIVMLNVLEHIEDDVAALRQARRMLKPDGLLIIEVPASPGCYNTFDRLVGHFRRYTMNDLIQRVNQSGFTVVERYHLGTLAYPAFRLLKLLENIRHRKGDDEMQSVLRTMRAGKKSIAQDLIFRLDDKIRAVARLPFGIRCFAVARRL